MKKTITIATIFLGVFLLAGMVSASDVATLQPASTITYNEDLTVNGTGRFDSVYIGKQGVGGVTFFNGTIINVGESIPVTFGDDVRIDGEIWRGPSKGTSDGQPLKISDTMIPTLTNINDLGSSSNRWQDLYLSGSLDGKNIKLSGDIEGKSADFSGELKVNEIVGLDDNDIPDDITVSNYLPLSGGIIQGNITVDGVSGLTDDDIPNNITIDNYLPSAGGSISGNLNVSGDLVVEGDITANDLIWENTKDSNITIPAISCTGSNIERYDNEIIRGANNSLPLSLYCPVQLPDQADLYGFVAHVYDNEANAAIQCQIKRVESDYVGSNYAPSVDIIANASSSDSPDWQRLLASPITANRLIDNNLYTYFVFCDAALDSTNIRIADFTFGIFKTKPD